MLATSASIGRCPLLLNAGKPKFEIANAIVEIDDFRIFSVAGAEAVKAIYCVDFSLISLNVCLRFIERCASTESKARGKYYQE